MKYTISKYHKTLKQKGALFIEYALILAFVIVLGVTFSSNNGMKDSVTVIFNKANRLLHLAADGYKVTMATSSGWLTLTSGKLSFYTANSTDPAAKPHLNWLQKVTTATAFDNLEAGTYEISFDLDAMANNLVKKGIYSNLDAAKTAAQNYINKTNVGIWCVEGSDITSDSKNLTLAGDFKNAQGTSTLGKTGNSGELSFKDGQKYQLVTTDPSSVGYNIVSGSKAEAEANKHFAEALVNGGIKYTKVD